MEAWIMSKALKGYSAVFERAYRKRSACHMQAPSSEDKLQNRTDTAVLSLDYYSYSLLRLTTSYYWRRSLTEWSGGVVTVDPTAHSSRRPMHDCVIKFRVRRNVKVLLKQLYARIKAFPVNCLLFAISYRQGELLTLNSKRLEAIQATHFNIETENRSRRSKQQTHLEINYAPFPAMSST